MEHKPLLRPTRAGGSNATPCSDERKIFHGGSGGRPARRAGVGLWFDRYRAGCHNRQRSAHGNPTRHNTL